MRKQIFKELNIERARQDKKWGADRDLNDHVWLTILNEEVGEVAECILNGDTEHLEEELNQCGAVVIAWIEGIRRRKNIEPYDWKNEWKDVPGLID